MNFGTGLKTRAGTGKPQWLPGLLLSAFAIMAAGLAAMPVAAQANENFAFYSGEQTQPVNHGAWGAFLGKYASRVISDDPAIGEITLIDYKNVRPEDQQALQNYIAGLAALDPTRLTEDEAFAYWVNLYNAVTINVILENYPVSSIKKIRSGIRPGPWRRDLVRVNGQNLTLDEIEKGILLTHWREPRIHYAVNCASIGCPDLALEPFQGARLEAQLDASAKRYINNPRGVRFEASGKLVLSNIFKWYRSDFGKTDTQVLNHVRRYANDDLRARLMEVTAIDAYAYDWSLNEKK